MGLDSTELQMATEEAFGVTFSDADAARMRTPRDVIDYVFAALGSGEPAPESALQSREQVRATIRRIICDQLGVDDDFSDDADFARDLGIA